MPLKKKPINFAICILRFALFLKEVPCKLFSMKKGQVVHYQEILEKGDVENLSQVKKRNLWQGLNQDERLQLASLFLKAGEQKVDKKESGDELCEYCFSAEELSCQSTEVLFHIAALLYRFGVTHEEKRYLLLSLGKLIQIEESDPQFYETTFQGSHLWGNLLVALSNHLNDDSFLAKALVKLKKAISILEKNDTGTSALLSEVYWDLAEAQVRLGRKSQEPADIKQAIDYYSKAASLGANQFHFLLDFGEAHVFYGLALSSVAFLKEGAKYFKRVITDADSSQNIFQVAYSRGWFLHAMTAKHIWDMTHDTHDFDEADSIFQEAIISHPEEAAVLWLAWGELFLRCGWYNKDPFLIDKALEKFTSTKLNEFDPIAVSVAITESLAMLGMCLDDFRLILEAKKRLTILLPEIKKNPIIHAAVAVVNFAQGIHFSDEAYHLHAYKHFEKAINFEPTSIHLRYMLSECAIAISELKKAAPWLRKGMKPLERLTTLRPDVPLFWSELGIALLKFYPHDKKASLAVETAMEKFKKAMGKRGLNADVKTVFHYGIALDLLGNKMGDAKILGEAIDILKFVLDRMPQSLNVRYQLAFAWLHLAELTQAITHFPTIITLFESVIKHDLEDDAAWCGLGIALLTYSELVFEGSENLKKEAENALSQAAKFGNGDANYYLACLYSLQGECEKSLDFVKRALHNDPQLKIEELEEEEWLSNLMQTEDFVQFRNQLKEDQ